MGEGLGYSSAGLKGARGTRGYRGVDILQFCSEIDEEEGVHLHVSAMPGLESLKNREGGGGTGWVGALADLRNMR